MKTSITKKSVVVAIATLLTAQMNAQFVALQPAQLNPSLISPYPIIGSKFSNIQVFDGNLGLYGIPSCDPKEATDIFQAARNIWMQPNVSVPGYKGAPNNGRVFVGETPSAFIPPFLPKFLVRGGGTIHSECGDSPNPDNIGLVSEGDFGTPVTSKNPNKWIAIGTRPSSQPEFNSYGLRSQWNNYAVGIAVQEKEHTDVKDAVINWQDGTSHAAPNSPHYTSANALLIQFRNGETPAGNPFNERFTVARYSINHGTGLVQINGNLSTGVFLSPSDMRLKKEITGMKNSLDIINRLNPVTYNYRAEEFGEMGLPAYKQYGFIAQEVEEVLPTHVVDLDNGFKSVNYVMLIPILTKGLQEMGNTVNALKQEIATLKSDNSGLMNELERKGIMPTNESGLNSLKDQFFQNRPNPFNEVTTINYAFKNDAAYKIIVTDLTGKKLKEFANLTGTGELQVSKNDLPSAGIYLYSLITANGEIAATKQMVFEK